MTYIDNFLLLIIISIFPIIIYYFFISYYKNIHDEEINFLSTIATLTTLYLILKYSVMLNKNAILISFIPIIITYILNKEKDALFLNSFLLYYLCIKINYSFLSILIISISLYLLYKLKIKNNKFIITSTFIIFITIIFIERIPINKELLLLIISYIGILEINYYILNLSNDMIKYHDSYKELIESEKLKTSLFKITHEIKNPLAVCVGYLDMLEEDNLEKYQKYTKIIQKEINRTLLLLQDFSNMSKININPEIMDINVLIEDITDNIKYLTNNKNISLNLELYDDELYINGDYGRLTQVLINIIKNSIEAISNKGKIIVKTSLEKNNIIIKVIDDGEGISKEKIDKIKEPFYSTKQNGSGLGVSLSQEIIKKHNGKISYDSIKDIGTTVTISIPAI